MDGRGTITAVSAAWAEAERAHPAFGTPALVDTSLAALWKAHSPPLEAILHGSAEGGALTLGDIELTVSRLGDPDGMLLVRRR